VWLVNHAAFPGIFLLFMALSTAFFFPDIWKGIVGLYLRATGRSRADTPQIEVFLENDGVLQVPNADGSLSKWIQFTVTPGNTVGLVSCEARVNRVINIAAND